MEDDVREQLALLTARVLGMRDVVARLLAYEADRSPEPIQLLQHFAEATAERTQDVIAGATEGAMLAQETIQKEVDWIVAAAQQMIAD
jgi:hypothetical protein